MTTPNDKTIEVMAEKMVQNMLFGLEDGKSYYGYFLDALKSAYSEGEARGYEKAISEEIRTGAQLSAQITEEMRKAKFEEFVGCVQRKAKAEGTIEGMRRAAEICMRQSESYGVALTRWNEEIESDLIAKKWACESLSKEILAAAEELERTK